MPDERLTPEQYARLQDAFEHALELSGSQRASYLGTLDADLGDRVRGLLDAHERTGRELESPISADAVQLLDPTWDRWISKRVGAWEIKRLVGAGGMGTVYEASRA